jgi:probable rRNA maturation factor
VSEADASIEVTVLCPEWQRSLPDAAELASWAARLALARGAPETDNASIDRVELGIRLADDAEQQRLNRDWRGIDRPTNVLAFPGWEPGELPPAGAPWLLGDVALAYETVAREAQQQGKAFADHFRHLIVHGVLHLLGYDHATETEASQMEALETSILAGLGVADPYYDTM